MSIQLILLKFPKTLYKKWKKLHFPSSIVLSFCDFSVKNPSIHENLCYNEVIGTSIFNGL